MIRRGKRAVSMHPLCCRSGLLTSSGSGRFEAGFVGDRMDQAIEDVAAIFRGQERLGGALGMRHQPGHIASFVGHTRDILNGAVRIGDLRGFAVFVHVLPEDLVVRPQLIELPFVRKIAAFAVGDGQTEEFSFGNFGGEDGVAISGLEENVFAAELEGSIADERARPSSEARSGWVASSG